MRQVYLDQQAATPVLPEVFEAMRPFFSEAFGAPASFHAHGLRARAALAKAREQVAALINAESPEEIIFTSSGTEAINLAVKGVAYAQQSRRRHLVASAIEHPAVLNSLEFLETQGFTSTRVKVDGIGIIHGEDLGTAITDQTSLVCGHCANHDLGTIQALNELAGIAQEKGVPLLVDANTAGGWFPIDVRAQGISLLSLAPHRFYGPKGVGILYRNRRVRLTNLIHGGVQEGGRRAGTENLPAIVGAGVAAELAQRDMPVRIAHTARLQKKLWAGLQARIPRIQLNGAPIGPQRLSTNLNLSIECIEGEGLVLLADTRGLAFTSGTACVSKALKVSPALSAIGLEHSLALATILLTLGKDNTDEEIDYVLELLPQLVERLRSMSPAWETLQKNLPA